MTCATSKPQRTIQTAQCVANRALCRDHYRLTLRVPSFPQALAGQFVHISPESQSDVESSKSNERWVIELQQPMLRRAFSIAGLRRGGDAAEIDVIYRVVGKASRWMASLGAQNSVSVLGPLGNRFPISEGKATAWMVAGGVGLPPMLWLSAALREAGKTAVAFCGAQSRDLLALTLDPTVKPDASATKATLSAKEFADYGSEVVISTDDGSLGYRGYVGQAMEAYHRANPISVDDLVVYTCGPEPMMRFVAEYCVARRIECYVCVERNMACGTGMCQSCVVPVRDTFDSAGWSYRLCCTDGPIFEARNILWETPD